MTEQREATRSGEITLADAPIGWPTEQRLSYVAGYNEAVAEIRRLRAELEAARSPGGRERELLEKIVMRAIKDGNYWRLDLDLQDEIRAALSAVPVGQPSAESAPTPLGWQVCPVCGGRGTVPWEFYEPAQSSSASPFSITCRTCDGRTVLPVGTPNPGETTHGE